MGELLNNAEPTARRVITAYNPDQKYKVNLKNLKACKAAPLEACAKLLGLARDKDNKKLYQNLGILSDRIILKIEALFEIDCDDCKETYRNKLGDTPPLHCKLCLQGSHSCEAIQKKLEAYKPIVDAGDTPTGIVWLCHECLKKNHLEGSHPYFYSYAKRFSKTKSTVAPLRSADGAITNDPQQKAELLQDQYVKVFSNPDAVNITECLANVQPELEEDVELDDFEFTEEDLISALKELDPYSATPDGDIPARILVSCKEQLATPLKLMNHCKVQPYHPH